jgi:rhomboid family GlyGly-CTERM serine protease
MSDAIAGTVAIRPVAVACRGWFRRNLDLAVFTLLLAVFNGHLLGVDLLPMQVFAPSSVADGEWWRIITHALVHVSWYHLLLDGGAFWLLYTGLDHRGSAGRLAVAGLCAGMSLAAVVAFEPQLDRLGLCGLSGSAHGLMAISGLEMMRKKGRLLLGLVSFWAVVAKSVWETITGQVMFEFMHMGLCGTALAAGHLGGVAGGIAAYLLWKSAISHHYRCLHPHPTRSPTGGP